MKTDKDIHEPAVFTYHITCLRKLCEDVLQKTKMEKREDIDVSNAGTMWQTQPMGGRNTLQNSTEFPVISKVKQKLLKKDKGGGGG